MNGINRRIFSEFEVNAPVESGNAFGMSIDDILDRYLEKRNNIISILRIYFKKDSEELASAIGVNMDELKRLENSVDLIPFQLVPRMATFFKVDLKILLIFLGHAKSMTSNPCADDGSFAIAAQYSGPDLAKQEKVDISNLFKTIIENAKGK